MANGKALPPAYLLITLAVMVALHFLLPVATVVTYPSNLLGSIPVVAGITLNLMADRALKIYKTTVKPFQVTTTLVTTGGIPHLETSHVSWDGPYTGWGGIINRIAVAVSGGRRIYSLYGVGFCPDGKTDARTDIRETLADLQTTGTAMDLGFEKSRPWRATDC
jgi:hypothetical protein